MSKHQSELRVYALMLRLYPREHRSQYGKQMLQTAEDMLADASTKPEKIAVWLRVGADLPLSVCKEHAHSIGVRMNNQNNYQLNIVIALGTLAALAGVLFPLYNMMMILIYHTSHTLRLPTPMRGLLFPILGLVIAGCTLFAMKAAYRQKNVSRGRIWLAIAAASISLVSIILLTINLMVFNG